MQIVSNQTRDMIELRRAVMLRDRQTQRRHSIGQSQLEDVEREFQMQLDQVSADREAAELRAAELAKEVSLHRSCFEEVFTELESTKEACEVRFFNYSTLLACQVFDRMLLDGCMRRASY